MLSLLDMNIMLVFFVVYGVIGIKLLQANSTVIASAIYLVIGFVLMGVITAMDTTTSPYMLEWWFSLRGIVFIAIGALLTLFIHRLLRGV